MNRFFIAVPLRNGLYTVTVLIAGSRSIALRDEASLAALTQDVVKTSEIEGEVLNVESLRDIAQLLELSVLNKSPGGGRSTGYVVADR